MAVAALGSPGHVSERGGIDFELGGGQRHVGTRWDVEDVNGGRVVVAVVLLVLTLGVGVAVRADAVGDGIPPLPIVVDAAWHRWELRHRAGAVRALEHDAHHRPGDDPGAHTAPVLQLRVKLMNITQDPVGGTVVLRVSLLGGGLEQDYLEATTRLYGAQALEQALAERGDQSPRRRAILHYLQRGRDLPKGQTYEPVEGARKRHVIRVKTSVRLRPGDTIEYDYEGAVPDDQGGHRVEVDVQAIEVGA